MNGHSVLAVAVALALLATASARWTTTGGVNHEVTVDLPAQLPTDHDLRRLRDDGRAGLGGEQVAGVTRLSSEGGRRIVIQLFLNCTTFWASVSPSDVEYTLSLTYLELDSGRRYRLPTVALTGRTSDEFGDTPFVLTQVVLHIGPTVAFSQAIPEECHKQIV